MKTKPEHVLSVQGILGEDEMKYATSSLYDFERLRQCDYLYIDKTEFVWKLIRRSGEAFFLSRPRRFGKSLLVTTLRDVFEGKRELFQGLAINNKPYEWKKYPVIHLSFADFSPAYDTGKDVEEYLLDKVNYVANYLSVGPLKSSKSAKAFAELIDEVSKNGEQAVVLIDEYDKPILDNLDNKRPGAILKVLKGFYSILKDRIAKLRLLFITGVSKFCHVSLFSNLNNLTDITLDPDYAEMLGFTADEIREYFAELISDAAKENGYDEKELVPLLLKWYDGYRFSKADTHVCNPVSIVSFFFHAFTFSNYWDRTGTPSFLLDLMREQDYDLEAALETWHDEKIFAAYELDKLDITGLLWQTGYLTIKDTLLDDTGLKYRLDFPDREVHQTFMSRLLEMYSGDRFKEGLVLISNFRQAIRQDDLDGFMKMFQAFLASIDYKLHLKAEKYYQTIFFVFFKLLGATIEAESRTNLGCVDAYIRTAKTIYIFEFKLNKTPKKAVEQIIDRLYYEKFCLCGLPIRLIGANFSFSKRNITAWK